MAYQDIAFEVEAGVAKITLNRPEQLNAFSGLMGDELGQALTHCDATDDVRAVVLTGAGNAFCAGADMSAGAETFGSRESMADFSASPVRPFFWQVRKPVIAAMNGHAVGIGLTLALQCDLRIAADDAKYGVLQVRRGVMPDACAHWTLPRIVGVERAAYLMLTGRKLTGREAAEFGLVLRSVPAEQVLETAMEIARDIAKNTSPMSVAVTKKLLWQSFESAAAEIEKLETRLHHVLMGAPDAIEGAVAYIERRPPEWTSKVSTDWRWPEPEDDGR